MCVGILPCARVVAEDAIVAERHQNLAKAVRSSIACLGELWDGQRAVDKDIGQVKLVGRDQALGVGVA